MNAKLMMKRKKNSWRISDDVSLHRPSKFDPVSYVVHVIFEMLSFWLLREFGRLKLHWFIIYICWHITVSTWYSALQNIYLFINFFYYYIFATPWCQQRHYVFRLSFHPFDCSSSQILLPRYLMNGSNNFDKTDREYSPATTDDLIRFWRSKVKVTVGRPCRHWGIKVHFLVFSIACVIVISLGRTGLCLSVKNRDKYSTVYTYVVIYSL